jgi:hypothetical protein
LANSCPKAQLIPNDCKVGSADISYAISNSSYVQSEFNF